MVNHIIDYPINDVTMDPKSYIAVILLVTVANVLDIRNYLNFVQS